LDSTWEEKELVDGQSLRRIERRSNRKEEELGGKAVVSYSAVFFPSSFFSPFSLFLADLSHNSALRALFYLDDYQISPVLTFLQSPRVLSSEVQTECSISSASSLLLLLYLLSLNQTSI